MRILLLIVDTKNSKNFSSSCCQMPYDQADSTIQRRPGRPENEAQLRAHIVKLCRTFSENLCRKVVTNARVRLQEVVRQNGGHIEHVLHYEQAAQGLHSEVVPRAF